MIDATTKSRLSALACLADEPSGDRRRELMREATDVFFAPDPPAPEVMALFEQAVEKLASVVETELRADLAKRFAPLSTTPRRLVQRLINDPEASVAAPMLTASALLTKEDLMHVACSGGQLHLRAVSSRHDLTEAISDRIVQRADDTTLGVLVANEHAPLSRASSETIVNRALSNSALHEAVVGRATLPIDLLNQMYTAVEVRLREQIIVRNEALPNEVLERALAGACTRVAELQGALPADYTASASYVDRLLDVGPIAPVTLLSFAKERGYTRLCIAISRASGVDFPAVIRVVRRCDIDAFALLCRAAGYDDEIFSAIVRTSMCDQLPLHEHVESFNKLSRETASRVVRFWKIRQATVVAHAA